MCFFVLKIILLVPQKNKINTKKEEKKQQEPDFICW